MNEDRQLSTERHYLLERMHKIHQAAGYRGLFRAYRCELILSLYEYPMHAAFRALARTPSNGRIRLRYLAAFWLTRQTGWLSRLFSRLAGLEGYLQWLRNLDSKGKLSTGCMSSQPHSRHEGRRK